ncbi:MAG: 1-deoxy-D-xylulose-5-phosphate synthase, partial [Clostridia bacterium]|nr:1-deoxy-D-xylulose-5-phosphate synthase [Clostridia bacterium]
HAVTFAGGLAAGNIIPVFCVYSTFLQRSYDQILHDAALQNLHIVLAVDRAGIVGEDGETHQGIFDTAFLNTIPNVTVYAPSCFEELRTMMYSALYTTKGVAVVRYPRGGELYLPDDFVPAKEPYTFYGSRDSKILIVTYGRLFSYACLAKETLQKKGIEICILKLNTIKPIAKSSVRKALSYDYCLFFEEGIKFGGVGETFGFKLYQQGYKGIYSLHAIENYVRQAKTTAALAKLGLDDKKMTETIIKVSQNGRKN